MLGNNTFTNNNFGGSLPAPLIDAGIVGTQSGNKCKAPSPPNLTCGTPTTPTPAPGVIGVYPPQGPTGGATAVTIVGSGFSKATKVSFGSKQATGVVVKGDSEITAVSPSGSAGTANVTVTTPGGTSPATAGAHFLYGNYPVVSAVSPAAAPVGATLTGSNFTGTTAVDFGSVAASNVLAVGPP